MPATGPLPEREAGPRVGGRLRFDIEDEGEHFTVHGVFLALDRPRLLQFTWSCSIWHDPHGFLHVGGYLPGPAHVYVPAALIRRHGLRPGDLIEGAAAPGPPEPDNRGKPRPTR